MGLWCILNMHIDGVGTELRELEIREDPGALSLDSCKNGWWTWEGEVRGWCIPQACSHASMRFAKNPCRGCDQLHCMLEE